MAKGRNKILALTAILLGACSHAGSRYHDRTMDFGSIKSVAVMPFWNLTKDNLAAERVRDVFTTMLLASGSIYVVPTGEVARAISRVSIASLNGVNRMFGSSGANGAR